jgi:RNA polymerase-associated protein LEO1
MSSDGNSENEFDNLFGSEDEASDIDDGRSQSSSPAPQPPPQQTSNGLDNLFGSDEEEESEEERPRRPLKQRR